MKPRRQGRRASLEDRKPALPRLPAMQTSLPLRLPLALALPAGFAPAQNLLGYDGTGLVRTEFHGPPAGPCAYPTGPVVAFFPAGPAPCPLPAPIPPPPFPLGDVAYNAAADAV